MSIEIGLLLAFAGCLAALGGWSGMRRSRRLKVQGVAVWAMTVQRPEPAGERERTDRTLLQYALDDGRVVERLGSAVRRGSTLEPGSKVLIWYDPADPDDVLIFGHDGRRSDWAFVIGGAVLILAGVVVAALAH